MQNSFISSNFRRLDPAVDAHIVPALVALEQQCFSTPWGLEQYEAAFAQSSFVAFGLYQENQLLAYVSLYHTLDEMEILNIAVAPQYRRQNLGYILLGKALEQGKGMGVERVVLEVRVGNIPARNLYEKLGFAQVGTRKKYYADTGEDACVYTLALEGFFMLS